MAVGKAGALALGGLGMLAVSALDHAALAQRSPSADSIINSLRPGAGMTGGTRGIRTLNQGSATPAPSATTPASAPASGPTSPQAPTSHPQTASPASRPQAPTPASTEAPSVSLSVQFATNSAELTPAAMRTLDELGRALSSNTLSTYHFRIEGHTDTVGNADHNQVLSEQRAKSVVDYLVSKFGIDRSRLDPVGMGQTHPIVITGNNVAEPRNRRVTVVNTGA